MTSKLKKIDYKIVVLLSRVPFVPLVILGVLAAGIFLTLEVFRSTNGDVKMTQVFAIFLLFPILLFFSIYYPRSSFYRFLERLRGVAPEFIAGDETLSEESLKKSFPSLEKIRVLLKERSSDSAAIRKWKHRERVKHSLSMVIVYLFLLPFSWEWFLILVVLAILLIKFYHSVIEWMGV